MPQCECYIGLHGAIKTDHIQLSIHGRNVHGSMGSHFDFRHATSFPILPVELSLYMRVDPFIHRALDDW